MLVLPPPKRPPDTQKKEPLKAQPRLPTVKSAPAILKQARGPLRVFIASTYGEAGCAIGHRLLREGHSVELFVAEPDCRSCGEGIIPIVDGIPGRFDHDLLVIADNGFSRLVEEVNIPVFGPNEKAEELENSREVGMAILSDHGIRIPPWKKFEKRQEAEAWMKKQGSKCVFKPNGNKAPKFLTYVAKEEDNSDLLAIMELAEHTFPEVWKEGFICQVKIEGTEMSMGSFFNGSRFLFPVAQNYEEKAYAPPPYSGPSTGEMGGSSIYLKDSKLFHEVTEKITPYLKKIKFHCDFDLNCILSADGPYVLEATARTGFPAICLQMSAFRKENFGHFLLDVATGKDRDIDVQYPWVAGVIRTVPPFPLEDEIKDPKKYEGLPVFGPILTSPDIYPLAVAKKDGKITTTGIGINDVCCGVGATVEEAKKHAYQNLEKIQVPQQYARQDISDRVAKVVPELKRRGYL